MAYYYCCAFVSPPSSTTSSSLLLLRTPHKKTTKILQHRRPQILPLSLSSALSDPFVLQLAENLEDSLSSSSSPLQKLRQTSSQSLLSKSWPSPKDELFRFTDTSFLKSSQIQPISIPPPSSSFSTCPQHIQFPSLTILDGYVAPSLSQFSSSLLPHSLFVGAISNVPAHLSSTILNALSTFTHGDIFWDLNGIGAPDVAVVYVPAGCRVDTPLHLNFSSLQGADGDESKLLPVSNPRALVVVEKGAEIGIIEEYSGSDDKRYWANSVMEIVIGEGAKVRHSYIQRQASDAAHIKWTFVQQVNFWLSFFLL
ncbi:hypothetical protein ACLOJK_019667 [Asimina triloba]